MFHKGFFGFALYNQSLVVPPSPVFLVLSIMTISSVTYDVTRRKVPEFVIADRMYVVKFNDSQVTSVRQISLYEVTKRSRGFDDK